MFVGILTHRFNPEVAHNAPAETLRFNFGKFAGTHLLFSRMRTG
jgi:hypothetical protein